MAAMGADTLRVQLPGGKALEIPVGEIELRFSRASGPGGQHVQKTETRVEAVFDVEASSALTETQKRRLLARAGPVLRAIAQDERSQWRNRELALERLSEAIAAGLKRERKRRATAPPPQARERRLAEKRRRGRTKRLREPPEPEDEGK
jgi:ribosome-associated protein